MALWREYASEIIRLVWLLAQLLTLLLEATSEQCLLPPLLVVGGMRLATLASLLANLLAILLAIASARYLLPSLLGVGGIHRVLSVGDGGSEAGFNSAITRSRRRRCAVASTTEFEK